jgi:hypothetical protein
MTPPGSPNPANDEGLPDDAREAKALFLAAIEQIVAGGDAVLTLSGTSTGELRLASGEIFLLGRETLTRIA